MQRQGGRAPLQATNAVPGAQTLRMSLALGLLAGRSLQSTAAELARNALLLAGWLASPASPRRLRGFQQQWFTLRRWHLVLAGLLGAKLLQWAYRLLRSLLRWRERQALRRRMRCALEYDEWSQAAGELDRLEGRDCQQVERMFNCGLLQKRTASLQSLRQRGDVFGLMFALRVDYLRSAGSITNDALVHTWLNCPMVPQTVQGYIEEVKLALEHIASSPELPLDDKLAFLRELRHAYGRTALVLSGGGTFGFWHCGVTRALFDANLLPRVMSGSSAGSLVAAMLCTRTDSELASLHDTFADMEGLDFFSNPSAGRILSHLLSKGTAHDYRVLQQRLQRLYGDITFAEAYQRTGRVLNIAVTAADTREPSRLLNYLTAPNVLIWSAVACSSAFPFLFAPQDLLAKDPEGNVVKFSMQGAAHMQRRWCDGSLEDDLPMRGLSEMFNVTFFLTSQCNPYLLWIMELKQYIPAKLARLLEWEFKHRCSQLLAVFPNARLLKLLAQPWEGDVTMFLPPTTFPLLKSATNFDANDIHQAMVTGQIAVWQKLPAIQSACAVEVAIDATLQQITRQARAQRRLEKAALQRKALASLPSSLRRSLPSWLHMPSLGLPYSESWDEMGGSMSPQHGRASLHLSSRDGSVHGDAAAHACCSGSHMNGSHHGHTSSCLGQVQEESAGEGEEGAAGSQQQAGQLASALTRAQVEQVAAELASAGIEATADALSELAPPEAPGARPEGGQAAWRDLALLGACRLGSVPDGRGAIAAAAATGAAAAAATAAAAAATSGLQGEPDS